MPTQPHSHSLPQGDGEEKIKVENSLVRVKTQRSLTSYCYKLKRTDLRKTHLLPIKIDMDGENKTKVKTIPFTSLIPRVRLSPLLAPLPSPPEQHKVEQRAQVMVST